MTIAAQRFRRRVKTLTDAEDSRRREKMRQELPPFSLEAFAGAHLQQQAVVAAVRGGAHRLHLECARQSGKTQIDDGILLDAGLFRPNSTNVLLGLTGPAVRDNNWVPVWKRLWDRFGGLDRDWHNERMVTTFPNGARVLFGGSDDIRHIKNILGGRVEDGVFIIDECQDQGAMLDELLDSTLPPMMGLGSTLILSGVFPEVPAGRFWEESGWVERDGKYVQLPKGGWQQFNWGRLANVHTPNARAELDRYLENTGLTEDDPQVQRDWFGVPAFDPAATAYHYHRDRNGYRPRMPDWVQQVYAAHAGELPDAKTLMYAHPMREMPNDGARYGLMAAVPDDGADMFSFALDPGSNSDRASIQGWAWGRKSRNVQHVVDWTSPRGARLTTGQMWAIGGMLQRVFLGLGGVCQWKYDAGSSQNTIDNLQADYRIPIVLAAKKTDMIGQVNRNNDLLHEARARIMIGSALEQDYQRARWDKNALARAEHKWGAYHPDASEAGRYALQGYYDGYEPPPAEKPKDGSEAEFAELLREAAVRRENEDAGMGFLNDETVFE